jgi:hypothetical protein
VTEAVASAVNRATFAQLSLNRRLGRMARACCSNPNPQLMWDSTAKKMVLQCMGCGAFC